MAPGAKPDLRLPIPGSRNLPRLRLHPEPHRVGPHPVARGLYPDPLPTGRPDVQPDRRAFGAGGIAGKFRRSPHRPPDGIEVDVTVELRRHGAGFQVTRPPACGS